MPRQIIAHEFGEPSVLRVVDAESGPLGADQVRIAVRAAGINPADWKQVAGMFGRNEANLPLHPGSEVAGVVSETGAEVSGVAVGDDVIAYRVSGGWSEEVVAAAKNVFAKPPSLGFDEASGLLLAGVTAWHLLESVGVRSGSTLLVSGGSGAVGRLAVQLAVYRGATVTATASPRRLDTVSALGATAISYGDGLEQRLRDAVPGGFDMAIDTAGSDEGLDACVALVGDPRLVATVAGFPHAAELGIRLLGSVPGGDTGTEIRNASRAPLIQLAGEGIISVEVSKTYALDDVVEALELSRTGAAGGKLVLRP